MCAGLATADNDLDLSTDNQTEGLMTAYQQRMLTTDGQVVVLLTESISLRV